MPRTGSSPRVSRVVLVCAVLSVVSFVLGWILSLQSADAPAGAPVVLLAADGADQGLPMPGGPLGSSLQQPDDDSAATPSLSVVIDGLAEPLHLVPALALRLEPSGAATERGPAAPRAVDPHPAGSLRYHAELKPGEWRLGLGLFGRDVTRDLVTVGQGEVERRIDARSAPGYEGRVVSARGEPLRDATVDLSPMPFVHPLRNSAGQDKTWLQPDMRCRALTRADGSFVFPFLPPDGMYQLRVSAPGACTWTSEALAPSRPTIERLPDIVLAPGRVVAGVVRWTDGSPVAHCPIRAQLLGSAAPVTTAANGEGRFVIEGLPEGVVAVWTESRSAVNAGASVGPTGDASIELVLQDGAWIDGVAVFDDGDPAAGLMLMGFQDGPADPIGLQAASSPPRQVTTDAVGGFRIGPFAPGSVRLVEPSRSLAEFTVTAPSSVNLTIPRPVKQSLAFRLLDADSGQPVTDGGQASVQWGAANLRGGVGALNVQPDASGLWPLNCTVPAGKPLRVNFEISGWEAATSELEGAVAASTVVEVRLRRERSLSILVLDQQDAPVIGATIRLLWPAALSRAGSGGGAARKPHAIGHSALLGEPAAVMEVTTDHEGRASAPRLAEGPLAWAVTAPGYFPTTGRVERLAAGTAGSADGQEEGRVEMTMVLRSAEALASR